MTILNSFAGNDKTHDVMLDKGYKPSFGICIVRGEVKDSPSSQVTGIFIKEIIPKSPADVCGKLKVGDRILTINHNDIRDASEETVFKLIRKAGQVIELEIQTFDKGDSKNSGAKHNNSTENGYITNGDIPKKGSVREPTPMSAEAKAEAKAEAIAASTFQPEEGDDEDEDFRDMTGRTLTAAGVEIDRASAGNVKLSAKQQKADTEQEDEFGYTTHKIRKRYGSMGTTYKVTIQKKLDEDLGLALAGHKDRSKMATMVAGINGKGKAAGSNLKPGDEILEVNGHVLLERCHLNSSVVFKNITTEKVVLVILRKPKSDMAVKPVRHFPPVIDETEYLFSTYKFVRKIQVQKVGVSLGLMIIEGKHADIGRGIFISDIQEGSNAMNAGLKVGEVILAINKDVVVDVEYESAVQMLKRTQGVVTLIVSALKSEEEQEAEEKAKEEQKRKEAEEKERKRKEQEEERTADPKTVQIKPNKKTTVEVQTDKKPLGVMVVGGKNNYVTTGVVVTHIYEDGPFGVDKRLQVFDQVLEMNGVKLDAKEMTTLKIYQMFHLPYDKVTLGVWRCDPLEVESIDLEVARKPGKDLGLAMVGNPKGVMISEIVSAGCADIDSRLQRGDIINKINGENLEGASFEECYAMFRQATGKVSLGILRPKPEART